MPDEFTDMLTRIAGTLPPVNWPAAEDLRRRGTARHRRRSIGAVLSIAAVVVVGLMVVQPARFANGPEHGGGPGDSATTGTCADGRVPAQIALPDRVNISVNVYNGTQTAGLAVDVGAALTLRGFRLGVTGNAEDIGVTVGDQVAILRYGPKEVGAAWVVFAYFPEAKLEFDIRRVDTTVDIVLGDRFVALPTPTEANINIANNGRATAPPGTCAGD